MDLLKGLNWRYATKKMTGKKIPQNQLDYILEAARLAPSLSGLQPYEIFVISNPSTLKDIRAVGYDQSPITECSHLLVFASWKNYTLEKITSVFDDMMSVRGLPKETMTNYKEIVWGMYEPLSNDWHAQHAAKQAYISFSMAIVAAAELEIDTTPMEGFLADKVDEILGLGDMGLTSAVILTLGYRDTENDWNVKLKKFRKSKDDILHWID